MTVNDTMKPEAPARLDDHKHAVSNASLNTVWPPLKLEEHPIDEFPSLRVIVVGAGISGITAGVLLPAKVPNIDLVIYERQNDLVSSIVQKNLTLIQHFIQGFLRSKIRIWS